MLILSDDVENTDPPVVNILLIVANVAIFFWMFFASHFNSEFFQTWGTVPARFSAHPTVDQFQFLFSSMFLHGGLLHLFGNMWALYLFGDNVEDRMGHFTYLIFYLACGVFADVLHIFSDPYSAIPAVGASGAIAGVMGAYMVLHPEATCKTWWGDDSFFFAFKTYKVPALFIICGWFCLQILSSSMSQHAGGVAFYAHIGGFLAGVGLLCFIHYREYQGSSDEPIRYGGALPSVCLAAFLMLGWHMIVPFTTTTVHPIYTEPAAHAQVAPSAQPHGKKKATSHVSTPKKSSGHSLGTKKSSTHTSSGTTKTSTHASAHSSAAGSSAGKKHATTANR